MFSLRSVDRFQLNDSTVFVVESPVSAKRTYAAMKAAIGDHVEIDGAVRSVIAFDLRMPLLDVEVGEPIGIMVGN